MYVRVSVQQYFASVIGWMVCVLNGDSELRVVASCDIFTVVLIAMEQARSQATFETRDL